MEFLSLSRRRSSSRNVPSSEDRGETDVFAGYAERVPTDELQPGDRPVWYLPHHPVTHPLKHEKVRVVFDCAAQFAHMSLNRRLLQGPDYTNNIVGVLTRFRQEFVGPSG